MQDLRGFGKVMPFTCGVMLISSVAMVGIPPLAGFVSKWNLLTAAADTGLAMGTVSVAALIISAVLTAIYLFTVAMPMYFRPLNEGVSFSQENRDPSWMMKLPLFILTLLVIGVGLFSQPLITFLRQIASGVIF